MCVCSNTEREREKKKLKKQGVRKYIVERSRHYNDLEVSSFMGYVDNFFKLSRATKVGS